MKLKYFLKDMVLPPLVSDFLRLLRNLPVVLRYARDLKKNKTFKDVKSGKVYILGNGPSLSEVNFLALSGHDVVTMNSFHRGEVNANLNVVAHCFGEPINSSAWMFDDFEDCLINNHAESHWVHYSSLSSAKELQIPVQIVVPGIEATLWRSSKVDLSSLSLGYASTAQLAIQVAMYLGYDDIVLLGFDHDWLASRDYSRHFYSDEKDLTDTLFQNSYLSILEMLERLWRLYISIAASATKSEIKITNCTRNSHLDVFPFELIDDFYLQDSDRKSVREDAL